MSRLLGVSVKTIRRWDKSGRIKCFRTVGGKRRIPESEVNRLLGTYNLISPVSSTVCVATEILIRFIYLYMY